MTRIVQTDLRPILDPPMIACPHCGGTEFAIRARVSGFTTERYAMSDGSLANNQQMWDDVRQDHDDRALCGDCGERIGRVIGFAPWTGERTPGRSVVRIVCLAEIDHSGRILLVRKEGQDFLILPGGKREGDESDLEALRRELREELGVGTVRRPSFLGVFRHAAGGVEDVDVEVTLYAGRLKDGARPLSEIRELHRVDMRAPGTPVAPSLEHVILPYLAARDARARS